MLLYTLTHLNVRDVIGMAKDGLLPGCSVELSDVHAFSCDACLAGKAQRQPSHRTDARAVDPLQLIHIDLWGPARTVSQAGSRYMLTCYDDHTRKVHVRFLRHKSDALAHVRSYVALVENQLSTTVKALRSDNGGEFTSVAFTSFLQSRGIEHIRVPPDAHAQNGRVERMHLTLLNGVRTVLAESGLPASFWPEAASYIAYVRNRSLNTAIGAIPEELWRRRSLSLKHLQPFGATAWYRLSSETDKLAPRGQKAVLVGFVEGTTFYRLWDPVLCKFLTSRDVAFTADPHLPAVTAVAPLLESEHNDIDVDDSSSSSSSGSLYGEIRFGESQRSSLNAPQPAVVAADDRSAIIGVPEAKEETLEPKDEPSDGDSPRSESPDPMLLQAVPRRSQRLASAQPSAVLSTTVSAPLPVSLDVPSVTSVANKADCMAETPSEPSAFVHIAYAATTSPNSYRDARNSGEWPQWQAAIRKELAQFDKYQVYDIVPRTADMKLVGGRWVFVRKIDGETGKPSTYKARWVAKGYLQVYGRDYNELFSSVAHKDSIRVFLSLVNYFDLECDQVDITAAFLNGELEETVYMHPPEGSDIPAGCALRLRKSLYGLKQSPRAFNRRLDAWLRSQAFTPTPADPCIYIRVRGSDVLLLSLHVDDQLCAGNSRTHLDAFKAALHAQFECVDHGDVGYFLGFNVYRDRQQRKLWISLEHYFDALLDKFDMANCNPAKTPLPPGFAPVVATDDDFAAARHLDYPQIVGSVLYAATITRPDLAHTASLLSRFISKWSLAHYAAAKHLLRYIRATSDLCLTFDAEAGKRLVLGFADADWGGCLDTRRSTTGYLFKVFGGVVSWKAKRQPTVALSTSEAEYMASADAARQAVWLRQLLTDLGLPLSGALPILNDNVGAIQLSKNPVHHDRSKHISLRHHFLREQAAAGSIELSHVSSDANLADVLTKPLAREPFERLRSQLGLQVLPRQGGLLDTGTASVTPLE